MGDLRPRTRPKPVPHTGLTLKQERFCEEYLRLGNASRAYRAAYAVRPETKDSTVYVSSAQLKADPRIALRIEQLRERALARLKLSREGLLLELRQERELAMETNNPAAAVAASRAIAQIAGLVRPDRPRMKGDAATEAGPPSPPPVSQYELARRIAYRLQQGRARLLGREAHLVGSAAEET